MTRKVPKAPATEFRRPAPAVNGSSDILAPEVVVASSASKNSNNHPIHEDKLPSYSTALSVTITVGCSLLALNVFVFVLVFHHRDKGKRKQMRNVPHQGSRSSFGSDTTAKKRENGGPMSTICVTSGKLYFCKVTAK